MPKLFSGPLFSRLHLSRLSAWTPAGSTACQPTTRPDAEPAGPDAGLVFDDPAYESFFAEYRQGRCEPPDRAAR
jgi:hypothetical protein